MKWIIVVTSILLFSINSYADSNSHNRQNITLQAWQKIGIGVENPGEVNDWVYSGIKTPEEALEWIDALKLLRGISFSDAAGIWKRDGFTAAEAKAWVEAGVRSSNHVKFWIYSGVRTPDALKRWQEIGMTDRHKIERWIATGLKTPKEVKSWLAIGINTPEDAAQWLRTGLKTASEVKAWRDIGVMYASDALNWIAAGESSVEKVKRWIDAGVKDGSACQEWKNIAEVSSPDEAKKWIEASLSPSDVVADQMQQQGSSSSIEVAQKNEFSQQNSETNSGITNTMQTVPSSRQSGGGGLLFYFVVLIFTIFKGVGENRTIVIFRDYNDLGLTFLIPVSSYLVFILFSSLGGDPKYGGIMALIIMLILFGILVRNTYEDNHGSLIYTILAIIVKLPLAFIWVLNFMAMLNPSGKTQKQRRKNRNSAMLLLAFLTPIIGMLVVKKEGSLFNPRDWIKGRRVGSIRKHL